MIIMAMVKPMMEIYEFLIVSRMKSSGTRFLVSCLCCSTAEMKVNKSLCTYH